MRWGLTYFHPKAEILTLLEKAQKWLTGCKEDAVMLRSWNLTRNFPPGCQPKLFKGRWLAGGTYKTAKGCRHWGSCWLLDSAARRDPPSWARQKLPALKEPSAAGVPISRLQEPEKTNTLEPGRKACVLRYLSSTLWWQSLAAAAC